MKIVLRLSEAEKSERSVFAFSHWERQEAGDEDVRMLLGNHLQFAREPGCCNPGAWTPGRHAQKLGKMGTWLKREAGALIMKIVRSRCTQRGAYRCAGHLPAGPAHPYYLLEEFHRLKGRRIHPPS